MGSLLLIQTKKKHSAYTCASPRLGASPRVVCPSPRFRSEGSAYHTFFFGKQASFEWKDITRLMHNPILLRVLVVLFLLLLCGVLLSSFLVGSMGFSWPAGSPPPFVYEQYVRMYPELGDKISDEETAEHHFFRKGLAEGRLPSLPRIIVQYTACTTCVEQLYSHLAALLIARELGPAEVVLPIAYTMDSSGNYTAFDVQSMVDVPALERFNKQLGNIIHQTPGSALKAFPPVDNDSQKDHAYQTFIYDGVDEHSIMKFSGIHRGLHDLNALVNHLYEEIGQKAMKLAADKKRNPKKRWTCIVNLPCTFFAVNGPSALLKLAAVAQSFAFSKQVRQLALQGLATLESKTGAREFSGFVISGPPDFLALTTADEEQERWTQMSFYAKKHLPEGPCYVGMETLFDLQDPTVLKQVESKLLGGTPCKSVITKYQLLGDQLNSFHSEQHKLLDMLILREAGLVLGPAASLMTLYLHEASFLRARQYKVILVSMPGEKALEALHAEGATFTGPSLLEARQQGVVTYSTDDEGEEDEFRKEVGEDGVIRIVT